MILLRYLLGDVLRQRRLRQGRTLREVSAAARISLGYLSEVERGQKEASSELLTSICDALTLRLSDVLRDVAEQVAGFEAAAPTPETVGDGAAIPASPASLPPSREPVAASGPRPEPVGAAAGVRSGDFPGAGWYSYPTFEPQSLRRGVFGDSFPTTKV